MRTALITGASRGIGAAIARDLGRDHHVLVGATSADGAQAIVDELPDAAPFVVDLTDAAALAEAVAGIDSLDVLVHSAGIAPYLPVAESTPQQWREAFDLNVFAVAELTRLLLPALRTARGTLVAINSGSGHHSGANNAIYSGTKFALRAFTDALRAEEQGRLRVTSVHPGRVDTDMQRAIVAAEGRDYDPGAFLRPDSVATAVRQALGSTPDTHPTEVVLRPRPH